MKFEWEKIVFFFPAHQSTLPNVQVQLKPPELPAAPFAGDMWRQRARPIAEVLVLISAFREKDHVTFALRLH